MAFSIREWLDKYKNKDIIFLFKGEITKSLITEYLDTVENKLNDILSNKARKKIYNVLVESLQNLYHHSSILPENNSVEEKGKYGVCILFKNGTGYHIITGNFIQDEQKKFLNKHLSYINTLDKQELKEFYKEILDNQQFSEKGGGGLGMVDISRKSGSKLNYNFYKYTNDYYFFSLDVNIEE